MAPKRPAPSSAPEKKKRVVKVMSLEEKIKVLDMLQTGLSNCAVGKHFGINESTVRSIKSKEREIRQTVSMSFQTSAKYTTKVRDRNVVQMESALNLWIEDCRSKNIQLDSATIRQKSVDLMAKLESRTGDFASSSGDGASTSGGPQAADGASTSAAGDGASTSAAGDGASTSAGPKEKKTKEPFKGSKGWFDKFKKRSQIRSVRIHGEAASADTEAARDYPATLQKLIEEGGYKPEQIFNMDETGLYWKKMPSRTYVTKDELKAPGFKAQKDRVTFIMCGNVAGHMIKPGFIYKAANPRALKNKNKSMLPVFWMSHPKAWITKVLIAKWFTDCFIPETYKYLRDLDMEFKVLLIMDNAGGHSVDLIHDNVRIEYLPPNTTSLLQPMDQGVIRAFKAVYTSNCLRHVVQAMDLDENFCLKTFWKSFTIASCLTVVETCLKEFKKETVHSAWSKLLPDFVKNYKGFTPEDISSAAVTNAVRLSKLLGGEGFTDMTSEHINELIEEHSETLGDDELLELTKSASEEEDEEEHAEEEEEHEGMTLERIADMRRRLAAMADECKHYDTNFNRAAAFGRSLFTVFAPYQTVFDELKKKREQLPITAYFGRVPRPPPAAAAIPVMALLKVYLEALIASLLLLLSGIDAELYTFNFEHDLDGWNSYRNTWHWSNRGGLNNPLPVPSGAGFAVMDAIYDSDELFTPYFNATLGGSFSMTFFVKSKWEGSNTLHVDVFKNNNFHYRLMDFSYLSSPANDKWITLSREFEPSDEDVLFVIFCFNGDFPTPPGELMNGCAIDEINVDVYRTAA